MNYLFLLSKDNIVDWFKYGTFLPYCPFVEAKYQEDELPEHKEKGRELLACANEFEYASEYYLAFVQSDKKISSPAKTAIPIANLCSIYALDEMSARIGIHLEPEVTIKNPIWPELFGEQQLEWDKKRCIEGVSNIAKIFGLSEKELKAQADKQIISSKVLDIVLSQMNNGIRPEGEQSIWTYLLRYERHQPYPKDSRGYLLDAIHSYNNYKKQKEVDANMSEKSPIGRLIIEQDEKSNVIDLLQVMEKQVVEKGKKNFVKETNDVFKDYYKVSSLFFALKATFSEGFSADKKYGNKTTEEMVRIILDNYGKKNFDKPFKFALYLLGLSLGRENTYQYVYMVKDSLLFLKP